MIRLRAQRRHRGMVVVYIAVILTVLIGVVGLGLDTAYVYLTANQLQNAADAAALAGAAQVQGSTSTAVTDAINTAAANRAGGASVQLASNPSNAAGGDVVIGTYNRTTGVFTPTLTSPNAVQVLARRTSGSPAEALPLNFGGIFGIKTSNVSRSSIAMASNIEGGVVILDPTASGSLSLNFLSFLTVNGGSIVVNSTSNSSVQGFLSEITAANLYTVSNTSVSGISFTGNLINDAPAVADPLAAVPVPAKGTTQQASKTAKLPTNLQPGYYPYGIIASNTSHTLAAGVYYIDGGISLTDSTLIATSGVMLYINTGAITEDLNSYIIINAPTTGAYANLAIFQSRTNASACTLAAIAADVSSGSFYFPDATINVIGAAALSVGTQLVCKDLTQAALTSITVNYAGQFPAQRYQGFLVK